MDYESTDLESAAHLAADEAFPVPPLDPTEVEARCGACGRDACDPCSECRELMLSNAFSGVDARHDFDYERPEKPQPDEDFYEWRNEL